MCLQAHMDVVCSKNADVEHDFATQGVRAHIDAEVRLGKRGQRGAGHARRGAREPVVSMDTNHSPSLTIPCVMFGLCGWVVVTSVSESRGHDPGGG